MPRTALLSDWIKQMFRPQFAEEELRIEPASADASFRRYFRVHLPDETTRIIMDAPPDKEDCRPFVDIAALFRQAGVNVPEVLAQDLEQGFLLLSDLGSTTYLQAMADRRAAPQLYRDANSALLALQLASRPGLLPDYDQALLQRELALFPDWYLARHIGVPKSLTRTPPLAWMASSCRYISSNRVVQPGKLSNWSPLLARRGHLAPNGWNDLAS